MASERTSAQRSVPALVAAISIAHDVGNPPFGHQGESAIRRWVVEESKRFRELRNGVRDEELLRDYIYFDGNPQGFRLVTQLQGVEHGALNLTASTLRAMLKYPWGSNSSKVDPEKPKFGFFETEKKFFDWSNEHTGLIEGLLHPLTPIMEACDDIAYSILDVEDGIKKELVSSAHLIVYLKNKSKGTKAERWIEVLTQQYYDDLEWLSNQGVTGRHAEDVSTQLLRSYLIALAVSVAVPALYDEVKEGNHCTRNPCTEEPRCGALLKLLKDYSKEFIYSHRTVERVELQGHRVIPQLLSAFWTAFDASNSKKASKLEEYVVKHVPQNYKRVYVRTKAEYPEWYARLQLVCDMVCGMTDSYAIKVHEEFKSLGIVV